MSAFTAPAAAPSASLNAVAARFTPTFLPTLSRPHPGIRSASLSSASSSRCALRGRSQGGGDHATCVSPAASVVSASETETRTRRHQPHPEKPVRPFGITRRYYLTDAGVAAFESNPNLIKADLGRIKKLRRLREKELPHARKIADLTSATRGQSPRLDDDQSPPIELEYTTTSQRSTKRLCADYDDSLEDLCEAA
jgi:hypothetical protein